MNVRFVDKPPKPIVLASLITACVCPCVYQIIPFLQQVTLEDLLNVPLNLPGIESLGPSIVQLVSLWLGLRKLQCRLRQDGVSMHFIHHHYAGWVLFHRQ